MYRIYKYDVSPDEFILDMPKGARILDVQTQLHGVVIWALVDTSDPKESRRFLTVETGQGLPDSINEYIYIGTFQLPSGLVFHLFDAGYMLK